VPAKIPTSIYVDYPENGDPLVRVNPWVLFPMEGLMRWDGATAERLETEQQLIRVRSRDAEGEAFRPLFTI